MKLIAPLVSLLLPTCTFAIVTTVAYDPVYDKKDFSLNGVACSNPLYKKYGTFGHTPNFPNIGGAFVVRESKSSGCGTCWNVTYPPREEPETVPRRTIQVFIVDSAQDVVTSREAMDELTDGRAVELGRVKVDFERVPVESCGVRDKGSH